MADQLPTDVFKHVVADHGDRYRAVMRAFAAAKQRFVVHLRPEDVHAELADTASPEQVAAALEQLTSWGNLRSDPDNARVTTVEDFNRARLLYQLTHAGEAAEQALAAFDAALGRRGELQAVALADIRDQLRALLAEATADRPDEGRVRVGLRTLVGTFESLASNAQAFMGGLQRTIDLHDVEVEAFLAYKDQLIAYVERFIGQLVTASAEVAGLLTALDDAGIDGLLIATATLEAADAGPDETDPVGVRLAAWRDRWTGLRQWFVGDAGQPAQARLLRRRARQAITALLGVVTELNERRSGRSDRSQDFRVLARWFAGAPTEDDCHRLWRMAFGLAGARHLTVDADTVAERAERPVPSATPWADAPAVHVSPRLRATGRYERRGKPTRVTDRTAERQLLADRLAAERVQIDAVRRRLATHGTVRLSDLGTLDRDAFGLLLALLGEALAWPTVPDRPVVATSTDGRMAITLTPTDDDVIARIPTDDGVLQGPDHHVDIRLVTPGGVPDPPPGSGAAVPGSSAAGRHRRGGTADTTARPSAVEVRS